MKISTGIKANALLRVKSLLVMGAGPNWTNRDFLLPAWKEHRKLIKLPQLRTATGDVVNIKGNMPLIVCIEDLHICAWFWIVENLAADVARDIVHPLIHTWNISYRGPNRQFGLEASADYYNKAGNSFDKEQ